MHSKGGVIGLISQKVNLFADISNWTN